VISKIQTEIVPYVFFFFPAEVFFLIGLIIVAAAFAFSSSINFCC
jgi:hypothetical protein